MTAARIDPAAVGGAGAANGGAARRPRAEQRHLPLPGSARDRRARQRVGHAGGGQGDGYIRNDK
eukprot:6832375-Pyramimonas_sp.AAC.2